MKEYIAETGGRYTYSDDILNLQELALSMSAVFDGCSDFIISGCEIEGPRVGSFDGGWGASYMARIVGQKKAREIWFLCRFYDATEALEMGLVNTVVPYEELEAETVQWCREILANSPIAIRCLKAALNADCDGQAGLQELAGNATLLYYMTEEGKEGKEAFLEKRRPNFKKFPRLP